MGEFDDVVVELEQLVLLLEAGGGWGRGRDEDGEEEEGDGSGGLAPKHTNSSGGGRNGGSGGRRMNGESGGRGRGTEPQRQRTGPCGLKEEIKEKKDTGTLALPVISHNKVGAEM